MGSNETKRKRGRPKGDSLLRYEYHMKMDATMNRRLDELVERTGMTRADIFREAFNMYANLKSYQEEEEMVSDDFYDEFYDEFEDSGVEF